MASRIMILGGTGVFGQRLLQHLMTFEGIDLFFTSRSSERATILTDELRDRFPKNRLTAVVLDQKRSLHVVLKELKPFAVLDCTGPFQSASYDRALSILESGSHLIDLADARGYLQGFHAQLEDIALRNGLVALTGASSTPALSTCVVYSLASNWHRIDTIDICITPAGKSEVGASVLAAIMSYAGNSITTWQSGQLTNVYGWLGGKIETISGLGYRRVAAVETYDAEHLGAMHRVQNRVSFMAGLESRLEQFGMECIAHLRKHRLIPHPRCLIPILLKLRKVTRIFTTDKGAMQVKVSGLNSAGLPTTAQWSLLAKQDHGPFIPILPVAAALRRLLEGKIPPGAETADRALKLSDIENEWEHYAISASTFVNPMPKSPFETAIHAKNFSKLPKPLQSFHCNNARPVWHGKSMVETGNGIIAKLLLRFCQMPRAGSKVPTLFTKERLKTAAGKNSELWTRTFGDNEFTSSLCGNGNGTISERFGPFTFLLGLNTDSKRLSLFSIGWQIGPLHLPSKLGPRLQAHEYEDENGRFNFDVKIDLPVFGSLIRYSGWLLPGPH